MQPLRLIIADDHPIVLKGLVGLLSDEAGVEIAEACPDGEAARDAILRHDPDIAILDVNMPRMTGTDVLAEVRRMRLRTRVIFLTASASDVQILTAIAGGAKAVLLKDMAADDLTRCLGIVASGGRWLPRQILDRALRADSPHAVAAAEAGRDLTAREREISLLVATGLSNKEIGRKLNVTDGTVKLHLNKIYGKLGLNNRTALAALAITCRDNFIVC